MKELKFNEEMQRAIDEGRKTQTRRVITFKNGTLAEDEDIPASFEDGSTENYVMDFTEHFPYWEPFYCPFGQIGDINNGVKITDIRVERLHDITENDASAEGAMNQFEKHGISKSSSSSWYAINDFRNIWKSIYPNHPTKAWELNPWVWVITFEKA